MLSREQIIKALKNLRENHSGEFLIMQIGLFGSVARGDCHEDSDVDVVVQLKKQDLFALIGIKQTLEDELGACVDVVSYRPGMNSLLKRRIDEEVIYA